MQLLNGIKKPDKEEAALPVMPTSPAAPFNMPSQPDRTTFPLAKDSISSLLTHGNTSEGVGSGSGVQPAKDVAAFNSLLPPLVKFVEGSSNGSFLQNLEGKYEPINGSPKAPVRQLEEEETKVSLCTTVCLVAINNFSGSRH